jgi:WD40 repeat protein
LALGDSSISVWDTREDFQYSVERKNPTGKGRVLCLGFAVNDQRILSGGDDGELRVWELKDYFWR